MAEGQELIVRIGCREARSPEECLLEETTPAADVFGLGVTLYELLTGKLPFPEMGEGDAYLQNLQAPSSIRQHLPAMPVGLERLVLGCLSLDPKARPNMAALLPSLHRLITSGPPMWPKGFDPAIVVD